MTTCRGCALLFSGLSLCTCCELMLLGSGWCSWISSALLAPVLLKTCRAVRFPLLISLYEQTSELRARRQALHGRPWSHLMRRSRHGSHEVAGLRRRLFSDGGMTLAELVYRLVCSHTRKCSRWMGLEGNTISQDRQASHAAPAIVTNGYNELFRCAGEEK